MHVGRVGAGNMSGRGACGVRGTYWMGARNVWAAKNILGGYDFRVVCRASVGHVHPMLYTRVGMRLMCIRCSIERLVSLSGVRIPQFTSNGLGRGIGV